MRLFPPLPDPVSQLGIFLSSSSSSSVKGFRRQRRRCRRRRRQKGVKSRKGNPVSHSRFQKDPFSLVRRLSPCVCVCVCISHVFTLVVRSLLISTCTSNPGTLSFRTVGYIYMSSVSQCRRRRRNCCNTVRTRDHCLSRFSLSSF